MKFAIVLLFGVITFLTFTANAQSESEECRHLRALANESYDKEENKTAVSRFLRVETNCGLDIEYWYRLLESLIAIINEEPHDSKLRKQYIDTTLLAWGKMEDAGIYRDHDDLLRATYFMQSSKPDYEKADSLFRRGIKAKGKSIHESHLVYAYYATYFIWENAYGVKKSKLKKTMLSDYILYSEIAYSKGASDNTHTALNNYFDYAFPNCIDLLPEVQTYMDSLPNDTLDAIHLIKKLEKLLDDRNCINNPVYTEVIDTWLKLDPDSFYARLRKIEISTNGGIEKMDSILVYVKDSLIREEIQYKKAYAEYKAGHYRKAYASGLKCTGSHKPTGLLIAAQSVAATANSCGDSTFDRKCNFIYAAQLAEKAGKIKIAEKYRSKGPATDCSKEIEMTPVTLSCWGVTVNVCP